MCLPNWSPGCKGEPRLKYQGANTSPVFENIAHIELIHHVVVSDVPDNEREGMHQCQNKEGIRDPAMEDLKLLVSNSCYQRDPICFACRRAAHSQYEEASELRWTYKRKGIHARASQPDLVPSGGELPQTISEPGQ